MKKILIISFLLTIVLLNSTVYVDQNGNGDFITIQEAINNSLTGGEIIVEEGTYDFTALDSNIDLTEDLYIHSRFDVNTPQNTYYIEHTTISAGANDTAIDIYGCDTNDFQIVIEGFSIKDGHYVNVSNRGHGVKAEGSNVALKLNYNYISDNTSKSRGAGINGISGDFEITNNKISQNTTTTQGGGIAIDSAVAIISNNEIYSNTSYYYGGGIGCFGSGNSYREYDVEILNNSIHDNISNRGGGIGITPDQQQYLIFDNDIFENETVNILDNGQVSFYAGGAGINISGNTHAINNRIVDNTSEYAGGGVVCGENETTNTIFDECLISENIATKGGGIYYESGEIDIVNCTIVNNNAYTSGGGIEMDAEFADPGDLELINPTIQNCILFDNQASGISNQINITSTAGIVDEVEIYYSCLDGNVNGISGDTSDLVYSNILGTDPLFVTTNDNYVLQMSSPCIDSGNHSLDYLDPDGTIADMGYKYYEQDVDNRNLSRNEWNWISFPRLRIDANEEALSWKVLTVLQPDLPSTITTIDGDPTSTGQTYDEVDFWDPINYTFDRVSGYKINCPSNDDLTLSVPGKRIEENTPVTLYTNQENWVGYFCENSSSPERALEGIWDDFQLVKHKDWAYCRLTPGGTVYKLLSSASVRPGFKYGQMAVIKMFRERDLVWNTDNALVTSHPESEIFTYDEKADYTPIYVELEEGSDATEVGVYVNSECKGFGIVTGDEAMIRVYLDETRDGGGEVEFVYYNGDRSQSTISSYSVYDADLKTMVKRKIDSRENRDFYNVSLRNDWTNEMTPKPKLSMNAYPNPFNPTTNISFFVPETEEASVEIFNIKGQKVKTLFNGVAHSGKNMLVWNGVDGSNQAVGSGIYFCRISTTKDKSSKKLMLLK